MNTTDASLTINRGDTPTIPVTVTLDGVALDITLFTFYMTAKKKEDIAANDSSAIFQKIVTNHIDPTHGKTQFTLTKADTSVSGEYVYDIEMVDGAGNVTSIARSELIIAQDVTYTPS